MAWGRIPKMEGIEAHELLRWGNIPVCAVRRRPEHWYCTLLKIAGTSVEVFLLGLDVPLDVVKQRCELQLMDMGWTPKENKQWQKQR